MCDFFSLFKAMNLKKLHFQLENFEGLQFSFGNSVKKHLLNSNRDENVESSNPHANKSPDSSTYV